MSFRLHDFFGMEDKYLCLYGVCGWCGVGRGGSVPLGTNNWCIPSPLQTLQTMYFFMIYFCSLLAPSQLWIFFKGGSCDVLLLFC